MSNTCSVNAIAQILNLKPRRVQALAQTGIIPKPEHGKYNLPGCIMAYSKYINDRTSKDDPSQKINKARIRLLEAQAAKAEMELQNCSKDYARITHVEKVLSNMLLTFRARILAIPYRAAALLTGVKEFYEIEQTLKQLLTEALNELSNYDLSVAVEEVAEVATQTTDETTETVEDEGADVIEPEASATQK